MKRLIATLTATFLAAGAYAADTPQDAQAPGSEGPKLRAEAIHLARKHGLDNTPPVEAQRAGNERAQAVAEEIHLKREHGNLPESAGERTMREAARL